MTASVDPTTRPANSAAPAGTRPATSTTAAETGSGNIKLATGWSAVPTHAKQVRGAASASLSSNLPEGAKNAIDEAFEQLKNAEFSLSQATDAYNANRNDPGSRERYQTEYEAAQAKVNEARAHLGQVYQRQTNDLALRSSLVPQEDRRSNAKNRSGNTEARLASVRMLRHWERVVSDTYKGFPLAQAELERQRLFNIQFRLGPELKTLGVVMNAPNGYLTAFQREEQANIASDARDYVIGPRPEEDGLHAKDLTNERLKRFNTLLMLATRVEDPARDKPLHRVAFDWVVGEINKQMVGLDSEQSAQFNEIVARYKPVCAA